MRRKRSQTYDVEHEAEEGIRRARDIALVMAGISIGAGFALLLTPTSGEEVRHAIGRGYRKTMRKIGRHSEDLRERAQELFERADELRERGARLLHIGDAKAVRRRA